MIGLSAREFHIYVTQGLQRQGSFKKDYQFEQAVDLALTQAQNRIVKARLIPGDTPYKFEVNAKYASDIEALIALNYPIFVTKDPILDIVYAQLPQNCGYLLGDSSLVVEDCQIEFKDVINNIAERVLSFPLTSAGSGPYYKSLIMGYDSQAITINTPGFSTLDEKVYIVDNIIEAFVSLGIEAYWEGYKNIKKVGCVLIVLRDTDINKTVSLSIDGVASSPTITDKTITTYKDLTTAATKVVNRDSKADYNGNLQQSYYYQSVPDSPIAIMNSDQLSIFQSKRFLVSKIYIDYVRKPKRICLALNQTSDLTDTVHEEIADLAIRLLKKKIEDQTYQLEVQDTVKRVE